MASIQKDVSLKYFSNYRIGGRTKYFLEVSNLLELKEGLAKWKKISEILPIFILGAGTNVLISDKGFDGLVIHPNIKFIKETPSTTSASSLQASSEQVISAGAGVLIEDLLAFCIENSLSGLEWAGGLPGTLGGAVRGNAGAFRGEIKDNIVEVTSLDIKTQQIKKRSIRDCRFDYRSGVFKSGDGEGEIIIQAVLNLIKGDKRDVENQIKDKIEYRRERHPLEYPNIGSIFKNIPVKKVPKKLLEQLKDSIKDDPFPILPTAKLLALAGLKGKRVEGAMVSQKHPNFIVNLGRATSEDVQKLIYQIKEIIKDKYGIELEEEITVLR